MIMRPPAILAPTTITIPTGCPRGEVKIEGVCKVPPFQGPIQCLTGETAVNGQCRPSKSLLPPERCAPGLPTEPNTACALITPPGTFSQADVGLMTHELCGEGAVMLWVAVILAGVCQ